VPASGSPSQHPFWGREEMMDNMRNPFKGFFRINRRATRAPLHWLLLLLPLLTACSLLEESPKYQFTDGVYKAVIPAVPTRRMYVEVHNDSIQVFPLLPSRTGIVIDSAEKVILLFPELRSQNAFRNYTFFKPSFDVDVITVPIKYRPRSVGFPRQLVSSVEAAVYLGSRFDAYRLHYQRTPLNVYERDIHHYGFSIGLFTGLGATEITPWVTQDQIGYEYSGVIWTKGIAGLAALNNFTLGLAVGTDWLVDRNRKYWIYQNRPWIGLTFGLNLN
jgi:hypothetical protein